MQRWQWTKVFHFLERIREVSNGSVASDAELLERYVRHRDEAAFELLLWRHGTLVFNVCHRILPREQDAEEAFQATFLAFIRKAHAIQRGSSVASWLYKVAYRVALEARSRLRRTGGYETNGVEHLATPPSEDPAWLELRPVLDEELNRLPERLRRPLILCYLEGKTNQEAARQLGCPMGTVFSRLARGRALLRQRLLRRGVSITLAVLTTVLGRHATEASPSAALMRTSVRAALQFAQGQAVAGISSHVTALAEGVLRTMFFSKVKLVSLVLFFVGLFAVGGVITQHALNAAPQAETPKKTPLEKQAIIGKEDDQKMLVKVIHPSPGGLERLGYYLGRVRASEQQDIYPAVSGYLQRQLVDIGDRVKKGDVLAKIDAPLLVKDAEQAAASLELAKGQYLEAKARVTTAEAELEAGISRVKQLEMKRKSEEANLKFREKQAQRYAELLKARSIDARMVEEQEERREAALQAVAATEGAISSARADEAVLKSKIQSAKSQLSSAEASLRIARIALEKAQIQVEFTNIRAGFDGVVTQRNYAIGDFIAAGTESARRPLFTIVRTDQMRIVVDVPAEDATFVQPGDRVSYFHGNSNHAELREVKVSRIGYALDEKKSTMPVQIDVRNPTDQFRPGMSMTMTFHLTRKTRADGVIIPKGCLGTDIEGMRYVYLVRDGKAHRTPVEVGRIEDNKCEITKGVKASDLVVADPTGLKDQVVPVEIKKEP